MATKVEASAFKRLHDAHGEEFKIWKGLFREDPEAPTRIDYLFSRRRIMLDRLQHWASAPVVSFIGCPVRKISRKDPHTH